MRTGDQVSAIGPETSLLSQPHVLRCHPRPMLVPTCQLCFDLCAPARPQWGGRAAVIRLNSTSSRWQREHVTTCRAQTAGLALGLDFGTSGARAALIQPSDNITLADARQSYQGSEASAEAWQQALFGVLAAIPADLRSQITRICIDGTSSTSLLVDRCSGAVLAQPKLYNEGQSPEAAAIAKAVAPQDHTATASSSALCKLITWHLDGVWQKAQAQGQDPGLLHQADWLAGQLHGQWSVTDWNNALKLGVDPAAGCFPEWLQSLEYSHLLPQRVVAPGEPVAPVTAEVARRTGLQEGCMVCGGTTDSIAAFIAAGATEQGEAVTSLGSSLAVKLISATRVDHAAYGIYAHRLGDQWLVGGSSNAGGAVLRKFFTDAQLVELTARIDPEISPDLDYYPLLRRGERFPVNDPELAPRLEPRPADDAHFLHGMLDSIARIEQEGFDLLAKLGASTLTKVCTAGGGAQNKKWLQMRERRLQVPVLASTETEACYGAALLAARSQVQ